MKYRNLGSSGLRLSEIAIGSWMTALSTDSQREVAENTLRSAYENGVNFFDCADGYSGGEAEKFLGTILKSYRRGSYVVSSKVYFPVGESEMERGLSRKHIFDNIDRSLKNLKTDYIDIYFCHRFDTTTPLDETLRALSDLVSQGKILYYGVSENWTAARLVEAQKIIDETRAKSKALFEEEQRKIAAKESAQRTWQEAQRKLKNWREQLEEEIPEPVFAGSAPQQVKSGDYVHLPKLNQYGYVLSEPDSDGEVFVQVGVIKLKAKLDELRAAHPEKQRKNSRRGAGNSGTIAMNKASSVEPVLDLHGFDTLEAEPILDKYLDDAFIAGLRTVEINHGRGTGALRKFVREYLKDHRLVKGYHTAANNEGGLGVTVVELNQ